MKYKKKIRGGSLQFVLFIGAVIAVLLLTFVLLSYTHLLFSKKTDRFVETIKRTDLVLQMALQEESSMERNSQRLPNDGISTEIDQKFWGVYSLNTVTATFQKNSFTRVALTGGRLPGPTTALFLKDNDRPMVIVGRAKIQGDAFLPKQGIRPGNIGGQAFYGNRPIQGRQRLSSRRLPGIDGEIRSSIAQLLAEAHQKNIVQPSLVTTNEIKNSFKEPTLWLDGDVLNLSGKKLIGNIIVRGTQQLVIEPTTHLQDVILVAPQVIIKDGVKGTFQVISSKNISVGKECELSYPSALVILDREKNKSAGRNSFGTSPEILISDHSIVKGVVSYFNEDDKQRYYPQIRIDADAQVVGQVHCEKNLELKGRVLGSVTTASFIAMENGNVYQNHLFNGEMDVTQVPGEFVGVGYASNAKQGVAKWLY
ncbi:hypothetical protein [Flagellimonas allohymeniacidonis]|uniref:Uncharacterized protein n=1 Tax=Flagellimonas allohymeniacidonis TaxID=2517819 RepID=A0A4V6MMA8_9FLAO|nr:hypothetical protein [Allomuricauda hymeniacidonis]TAI48500.1 hypothetical protein EW142_01460 [Allomuricauda hymeniacidonis]